MKKKKDISEYPFEIRTLTPEEGGGYLISYLDFNVCWGDGETIEDAIADGKKALAATIDAYKAEGWTIPEPGSYAAYSGKFVQRIPKSMHARLQEQAKREGVSINTLATSYIAAGIAGHGGCSEGSERYHKRAVSAIKGKSKKQ
jgi:antitoxin HicB